MNTNKIKLILFSSIAFLILLSLVVFLIWDSQKTKSENLEKQKAQEQYQAKIPTNVKEFIPEKGQLIFLEFFEHDRNNIPLTRLKDFRKALYYCLNRKSLAKINSNFKEAPVLFTQEVFLDNKVYFDQLFFPQSKESNKMYEDADLANAGYNFQKALDFLGNSWNSLTQEEKNQDYEIKLALDLDFDDGVLTEQQKDEIKEKIVEEIKCLFADFITKSNLRSSTLTLKTDGINTSNMNVRLSNLTLKDEYNEEDYHFFNLKFFSEYRSHSQDQNQIIFNFKAIKEYLLKQKNAGKEIDEKFFSGVTPENEFLYEKQYPGINNQGYYTSRIVQFWDFYDELILKLIPRQSQEFSYELKAVKQKTYEEIFEKILCFVFENSFFIPIIVV